MNRYFGVPAFLTLALSAAACGDGGPAAPTSMAGPLFASAVMTPVTATVPLAVVDPGQVTITGGVLHIRDQVAAGPISGDIVGTQRVVTDVEIVLATGEGTGRGTFVTSTAGGTWEGRFQGKIDGPVFAGTLQGKGSGAMEGLKLQATFTDEADPVNNVFILTGRILDPNAR